MFSVMDFFPPPSLSCSTHTWFIVNASARNFYWKEPFTLILLRTLIPQKESLFFSCFSQQFSLLYLALRFIARSLCKGDCRKKKHCLHNQMPTVTPIGCGWFLPQSPATISRTISLYALFHHPQISALTALWISMQLNHVGLIWLARMSVKASTMYSLASSALSFDESQV